MKTMSNKWIQTLRLLNFPKAVRQVWWELIRPKNVKLFIEESQKKGMSRKTMCHTPEYYFRLAWLINSKPFTIFIY